MAFKKPQCGNVCFFTNGYINIWPTYAIFSDFVNGYSLAWYSTLKQNYVNGIGGHPEEIS